MLETLQDIFLNLEHCSKQNERTNERYAKPLSCETETITNRLSFCEAYKFLHRGGFRERRAVLLSLQFPEGCDHSGTLIDCVRSH